MCLKRLDICEAGEYIEEFFEPDGIERTTTLALRRNFHWWPGEREGIYLGTLYRCQRDMLPFDLESKRPGDTQRRGCRTPIVMREASAASTGIFAAGGICSGWKSEKVEWKGKRTTVFQVAYRAQPLKTTSPQAKASGHPQHVLRSAKWMA